MERNAFNPKPVAPLPKFICSVLGLNFTKPWEKRAGLGKQAQDSSNFLAEPDERRFDFSALRVLELVRGEILVTSSWAALAKLFKAGKVPAYESHPVLAGAPSEPRN